MHCEECEGIARMVCYECGGEYGTLLCMDCSKMLHALRKRKSHAVKEIDEQPEDDPLSNEGYKEYCVELSKEIDDSVGIIFHQPGNAVFVSGFSAKQDEIQLGDVVIQVQSLDVVGKPLDTVLEAIRDAPSPVSLHFLHQKGTLPDELLRTHALRFQSEAEIEYQREIISLEKQENGSYCLSLNEFNCKSMIMDDSDERIPVYSCLGNTTAGKSFIIRSLMAKSEVSPFCFEQEKMCSTTANANMFTSENIMSDQRVNIIDFEGENGLSPFMDMVRKTKDLLNITSGENKLRHLAVKQYFPKIAYLLSDVIVLVGDTSLVNKDYFTRCCEFAEKANKGVSETMCRPSLLIIHNKCSLASVFDVEATTREFMEAHIYNEYEIVISNVNEVYCIEPSKDILRDTCPTHENPTLYCSLYSIMGPDSISRGSGLGKTKLCHGDLIVSINNEPMGDKSAEEVNAILSACENPPKLRMRPLRSSFAMGNGFLDYFSEISCIRLPRGDIRQNIRGKWYNGDEILQSQLVKVREKLSEMTKKQSQMRRDISVGERGWFFLLKAIVHNVSNNRPVSFGSLLHSLLSSGDQDVDRIRAIFLRIYDRKVHKTFLWFQQCVRFTVNVFARMIAINMSQQADSSILTRETVTAHARKSLSHLLVCLERYLPCGAVYPRYPEYICGQQKMFHNGHRTCERVPVAGNMINRVLNQSLVLRHEVWPGSFECSAMPLDFLVIEHWEKPFFDIVFNVLDTTTSFAGLADTPGAKKNAEFFHSSVENDATMMDLRFKVFGDASMAQLPCLRCFRGCRASMQGPSGLDTPTKLKMRVLQWHSKFELMYLSPQHLALCASCRPFVPEELMD